MNAFRTHGALAALVALRPSLAWCDAAQPWQFWFQDPATPVAEGILRFHHDLMFVLVLVVIFVTWMLMRTLHFFHHDKNPRPSGLVHGTTLEIVWTLVPAVILMVIAVPSFALLYSVEEMASPRITVKVSGHQWYWTYEYSDYEVDGEAGLVFDSYMLPDEDLEPGSYRLLEVDNRVVLPVDTHIRLVITSRDVLHCWAVPSFGIKMDACPGRLNQSSLFIERPGTFYGQCSEICGINHGFMPIAVEAVRLEQYVTWVAAKLEEVL